MRTRIRDTAKMVAEAILADPRNDINIGLIAYSKDVHHIIYLNNTFSQNELVDAIENSPITGTACRTQTNEALDDANNFFFKTRDPNDPKAQILYLFTDGFTYKRVLIPDTVAKAKVLKDAGVILNVIQVPHKRGKTDTDEFQTLPSPDRHFKIDSDMVAVDLYEKMSLDAPCEPFYGEY
ncbi:unnamed protein product [Owenia fusiformis]|nr:unnamed protein product [Owenia fusiformis]